MQSKKQNVFNTIRTEGGILPADLLQRIAEGNNSIEGLSASSYHLYPGVKINEEINRSWNRLLGAWSAFHVAKDKLPDSDKGTPLTRERWLLPLFQELGYGRLVAGKKSYEIDGKPYPVSHFWQKAPIHLLSFRMSLDRRTPGFAGATQVSPHGMLQEFLNRSPEHLWAFMSNGLYLRILRDNVTLTRQSFVEFDLEIMMQGEMYADFALLWMLCHQSRVEAENERMENCWLEKWSKLAQKQGTRALEQLRSGVEKAIIAFGRGFLTYPTNFKLKENLRSGELNTQDYYRQLLRLVYRLIFLFAAEDRDILLNPHADKEAQERYENYYSTTRLRRLAERLRGTNHIDLWRSLTVVMSKLHEQGCPELALPALGSLLWSESAIPELNESDIDNRHFLEAVRELSFIVDNNVRRAVDYRNLGTEELGSIYESLLELHPEMNAQAGTFSLQTASGHERKTTGSYYTPSELIHCLLDSALQPVLDEAADQENAEEAILNLKVCDPACGSGHFLIAAAHRIAKKLATIRTGEPEPAPSDLRNVISRCLFGVDLNPMAVELCKVALWMEALEAGKPLSFIAHHIKCGNSLLGTTPALIEKGIPNEAFSPIVGDDKAIASALKKRNREESKGQLTFFTDFVAEAPAIYGGDLSDRFTVLEELPENSIQQVAQKKTRYRDLIESEKYHRENLMATAWCAAFVWPKTKDAPEAVTEGMFRKLVHETEKSGKQILPLETLKKVESLAREYRFFQWHLEFPQVFYVPGPVEKPENTQTGLSGGFDVVLGNPPWERIKLQEKEWFTSRRPDIANAPNAAKRRKMIQQLESEAPELYYAFQEDRRKAEGAGHFIRNSKSYPLCGRGDVNTYAIFSEKVRDVLRGRSKAGIIVPSGIATDDTTKYFFQNIMETKTLSSLYDFENRQGIFTGVHRSYKFSLLTAPKRPQKSKIDK